MQVHDQRQERRRRGGPACRERGFTLIEILVVLLIVGLAALIAVPNMRRATVRARANSGITAVVSPFNLARAEAVKRHSPIGVLYDESTRMITVYEDWDPANAAVGTNRDGTLNGAEETVDFKPFPSGLLVDPGANPLDAISKVIYRPDGTLDTLVSNPTDGGVAGLIDRAGNRFEVRINGVTGGVTVAGLNGAGSWTTVKEAWEWKY